MATCVAMIQLHQQNVHDSADTRQGPPKMPRPTLTQGINEEDWNEFTRQWELFCKGTSLGPSQTSAQLLACCEATLHNTLFREDPRIADKKTDDILSAMKRLAVLQVALCARRAAMLSTKQDPAENVRQYALRVRGLTNVCQWQASGR